MAVEVARVHSHPAVADALPRRRPVVALESTLIAHGLPQPDNLELAREVEEIVRAEGAVPATIAVIGGVPHVGISAENLRHLATAKGIAKLSLRDLPMAAALGRDGATTVAATAVLASAAGIRLFATGGLGGVHRGARETWDESADLTTLSHTRIAVVCAGVKSILDISATLERLETLNVPVLGYRTRTFPGFYLADTGIPLEWSVDTPNDVATVIQAQDDLEYRGGLVIANPIPEAEQLDPALHDQVLATGLAEAERQGITGKGVTPFLLEYVRTATGGESLRVNKQIIRNNARLAAQIAVALGERSA